MTDSDPIGNGVVAISKKGVRVDRAYLMTIYNGG
jgi:hypothetical protein